MGSFPSETFFKSFQVNIAKNSQCTGREKTSEKNKHQIFMLPNLCGSQLISTWLLLSLFLLFLGISFQQLNFE
jgi:hypothetical protein